MSDISDDSASSVGDIVEEASEPDTTAFKCLFSDRQWHRVSDMITHCRTEHGFDLEAAIKSLGPETDELDVIKLINYIRSEAAKGTEPKGIMISRDELASDKYLQPVLEDDALLFQLGELMPEPDTKTMDYDQYEAALHRDVPSDVEKIDAGNDRDTLYFDSYKGANIHREMIEDGVRTEGYRDFIQKNVNFFAGKTVLDVGCGTGILSLFCARMGAAKVYAVDNSAIASRAREIISKNGYQDTISVIQGRIEDFNTQRQIGLGKIDVIISEWMGYGLLFEGMLDSVLRARDLYLKPDGVMVPSHCTLRIAPISDREWIGESTGEKFWRNVHGFDFSPMIPGGVLNEREIGIFDVPPKAICGSTCTFYTLDIKNVTVQDLDFTAPFEITMGKYLDSLDAFAIWFDTFFVPPGSSQGAEAIEVESWGHNGEPGLGFSTGPYSTPTHWHQAVLLLGREERGRSLKAGSTLKGTVSYKKRRRDDRAIDVDIAWKGEGKDGPVSGSLRRIMA